MNSTISKACKHTLIAALSRILAAEFVQLNTPEAAALLWHLRHGSRTQCCGVQSHVPLRYFVLDNPRSLSLLGTPSYIRWKLFHSPISTISLYAQAGNYDEAQVRQGRKRLIASCEHLGNRLVGSKIIQVAGKPLECSELYIDHFGVFGSHNTVFGMGNGLSVLFEGSPALLNEFYSMAQGAHATQ